LGPENCEALQAVGRFALNFETLLPFAFDEKSRFRASLARMASHMPDIA
jgi:hypothetical protein